MKLPPLAFKVPDHPKMLDRLAGGFRVQVLAEAVSMARYDDEMTVALWRSRAQKLVETVNWKSDDAREAFADRLASIVQEGQVRREEVRAQGGAA